MSYSAPQSAGASVVGPLLKIPFVIGLYQFSCWDTYLWAIASWLAMFWVGFSQEKLINHRNLRLPEGLSKMHTRWICPLHNMELRPRSGKMFSLLKFTPKCVWWAEHRHIPLHFPQREESHLQEVSWRRGGAAFRQRGKRWALPTPLLHSALETPPTKPWKYRAALWGQGDLTPSSAMPTEPP